MRLLFLTSRLPWPPDRGDKIRTFNILRKLSEDHEIYLVSFVADKSEEAEVKILEQYCHEIHTVNLPFWQSVFSVCLNGWRGSPLQVEYYRSKKMDRLIDRIIVDEQIDAVYVHLFRMAPYVSKQSGLFRIVDLTDIISQEISSSLPYRSIPSRFIYKVEVKRIASYECLVAKWADETWLVSQSDILRLERVCPGKNVQLVPIGVDRDVFFPMNRKPRKNKLIFVGNLNVFHNVDAITYFVQDIFPIIKGTVPDCSFTIVGAGESSKVRNLANVPGVTLSGFVENLNEELNKAVIFVAPLRFSAGVQFKVLQAMAAGVPVIATRNVAAGLGARPEHEIEVADNAQEFAEKVIKLLKDHQQRSALGLAGRTFIEDQFSWHMVADRVKIIESRILKKE